jgi:hypothetical protein
VPVLLCVVLIAGVRLLGRDVASFGSDPGPAASSETGIGQALFERQRQNSEVMERLAGTFMGLPLACVEFPSGKGLGLAQNGQMLVATGEAAIVFHEYDLARVVYEVGVVGMLAVLLLRLSFLVLTWQSLVFPAPSARRWLDLRRAGLAAVAAWAVGQTCFNHVGCTFAWLVAAVVMATFEIERRSVRLRGDALSLSRQTQP